MTCSSGNPAVEPRPGGVKSNKTCLLDLGPLWLRALLALLAAAFYFLVPPLRAALNAIMALLLASFDRWLSQPEELRPRTLRLIGSCVPARRRELRTFASCLPARAGLRRSGSAQILHQATQVFAQGIIPFLESRPFSTSSFRMNLVRNSGIP